MPSPDRLRRSQDVRAVLRRGRRRASERVVVHVLRRDDGGPARVTTVATTKVGGAVQRNRAKRVLREAARVVTFAPGVDVALVARPATVGASPEQVCTDIERLFDAQAPDRVVVR